MFLLPLLMACSGSETPKTDAPKAEAPKAEAPKAEAPAGPVQEALEGGPFPALLLAEAWFKEGSDGKPKPQPAAMMIWRQTPDGWKSVRVEDPDSNVFHKVIPFEGGILTAGGEKAFLKYWTFKDGKWSAESLWNPSWGGKFNRVRDLEIGDVNGDGKDDLVMATHDAGVIAVGSRGADGKWAFTELDKTPDTFVHEVEIGDIDNDGKNEFFATPTGRNQASGKSQPGQLVMYKWDGTTYKRTVVEDYPASHAKEILAADIDGKPGVELFAVLEAETELSGGAAKIVKPVEIRQYRLQKDGSFKGEQVFTIDDKQTRFLVHADLDGDGKQDLVAAAMKTGLWFLTQGADGKWTGNNFERNSSGFEHACYPADLNNDGKVELYVASDEQNEVRQYLYNPSTRLFDKTVIGPVGARTFTWNITAGAL